MNVYTTILLVVWCSIAVSAAKTSWLLSRKVQIFRQVALALSATLVVFIGGFSVRVAILSFMVHLFFVYVFYYKFIMKEPLLKVVDARQLIKVCKNREKKCIKGYVYISHFLFFAVIAFSLFHYSYR